MATELPPEQHASYSAIIDDILAHSDLNTISAKRIRKGLQERVDYDITPQKPAITDLIMVRFDKFQREQDALAHSNNGTHPTASEPPPTTNGTGVHVKPEAQDDYSRDETSELASPTKRKAGAVSDDDDDLSELADSPPPKKVKKEKVKATSAIETDEEIAKRMQAELNAQSARSTRGGGAARRKPAAGKKGQDKKTPSKKKKKSKAKVNSDDDSDVERDSDGNEKPSRPKTGGFHKPFLLSEPLAALVGESALSRPQTVKKIWEYVRAHELQEPSDKRQIRCDDPMRAVFRQEKVNMFTMNKLLAQHLFPMDE